MKRSIASTLQLRFVLLLLTTLVVACPVWSAAGDEPSIKGAAVNAVKGDKKDKGVLNKNEGVLNRDDDKAALGREGDLNRGAKDGSGKGDGSIKKKAAATAAKKAATAAAAGIATKKVTDAIRNKD